jgi:5-methylcytosine-specific restriction protein A
MSPFRKCQHPTCGALVREGTGSRCPTHQAAAEAKRREYDRARSTDAFRIYSTPEWRAFRTQILAQRPACVDCGGAATDLDHLVPVREAPGRALDPTNVTPRCHRDHSRRTSREHSWNRGRCPSLP